MEGYTVICPGRPLICKDVDLMSFPDEMGCQQVKVSFCPAKGVIFFSDDCYIHPKILSELVTPNHHNVIPNLVLNLFQYCFWISYPCII